MTTLIQTLTNDQLRTLLQGGVTPLFSAMITSTDPYYAYREQLCNTYYLNRSGNKPISVGYQNIIDIKEANPTIITQDADRYLGNMVRQQYLDKWTRIYNALVTQTYNALDNVSMDETYSDTINRDTTYGRKDTKTANNSDITTYDTNVEENGKTGTNEVTSTSVSNEENVYGFNSSDAVGDNTSKSTTTETTQGAPEDNTTYNSTDKTGTETKAFTVDESVARSGKDEEEETRSGVRSKIGRDKSGAELISEELDLRMKATFFDIVLNDIDKLVVLPIYI